MAEEDREDLRALQAGDKGAWDGFVGRYAGLIYSAASRRLAAARRMDDVDDVMQDVFLRLCRNDFHLLRSYDPKKAKLTTWLTVIATSVAIDHLRRQKRRGESLESVPDRLLSVDAKEPVWINIPDGLLSARQALVLELLYEREMETAEAAKLLEVDSQTIRSTHHKALTKLRRHFAEDEAETRDKRGDGT